MSCPLFSAFDPDERDGAGALRQRGAALGRAPGRDAIVDAPAGSAPACPATASPSNGVGGSAAAAGDIAPQGTSN